MSRRSFNPWHPLTAACFIGLAIIIGLIIGTSIGAAESDAGIYQFACFYQFGCLHQYAYMHAEDGLKITLGSVSVTVILLYGALWLLGGRYSEPACDCDIRDGVRACMTKLPFATDNDECKLFRLQTQKEFAAEVAKAKAKSAALQLLAGANYSPCDFLYAIKVLKEKFKDDFRHLYIGSVHHEHHHVMAVAEIDEGYALGLREGHYYAVKEFLALIASGADLTAALAARHFAVAPVPIDESPSEFMRELSKGEGPGGLVRSKSGRVIGLISFAKVVSLMLAHKEAC